MLDFIIPTCIRSDLHMRQLIRCTDSIRKFHPSDRIILINDSDTNYTKMIYDQYSHDESILVVPSIHKGSADQQIFKVFLHYGSSQAIFIQDSTILEKKIQDIPNINEPPKFLWHFTNHRLDWDIIEEPQTDFNVKNNIYTHTDLVMYTLLRNYNDYPEFLAFALYGMRNKDAWCGCFGNLCLISRDTLIWMNSKVPFIDKFIMSTDNRARRANESIFSLLCHFLFPQVDFSDSYDGLYFDGINTNEWMGKPTGFDNLVWCCRKDKLSKVSFNR